MSDKDRFTFDDNDDFPEADLSSAFSDGEFEADNPAPGVQEEPEPVERQQSRDTDKSSGSGSSRTRILLVVLLLVVAGGAGAYYFMDLGGTAPVVPTVPVPAQKAQKSVALPPQPAQVPPAKVQPAAKPVSVAVPPPPPTQPATRPVAEEPSQPAPEQQVAVSKPEPAPVAKPVETPAQEASAKPAVQMAAPAPKPAVQPVAQAKPEATVKPAQQTAEAMVAPTPKPMPTPEQTAAPKQVAGGGFALDAGSYLFESNRDSLITRIKKLGYKPLVTPVDAKLDMTRLRLGTYRKEEVQKALEFARSIEPGAYTAPAGDGYVIYAGTFLRQGTVDKLTKRFLAEGVKVYPEPVQVVRTLSRIRFGSFATRADATAAVNAAGKAGVKAVVVTAN
jgi:cell division septation protein DedD